MVVSLYVGMSICLYMGECVYMCVFECVSVSPCLCVSVSLCVRVASPCTCACLHAHLCGIVRAQLRDCRCRASARARASLAPRLRHVFSLGPDQALDVTHHGAKSRGREIPETDARLA